MSEFEKDTNNEELEVGKETLHQESIEAPKPNIAVELLMGLGFSILAYFIIMYLTLGNMSLLGKALFDFVILTVYGFLIIKFFRTNHVTAAIIMLILIAPIILLLLLFGACGLMVSPY